MSSTRGLYGSSTEMNIPRVAMAELTGTYLLVLVGTAVASSASLEQAIAGPAADSLSVALTFGLMLAALVSALGHISGCHLNPAVTLGLAVTRRFPWRYVPSYVGCQFVGAYLASLTVLGLYGDEARSTALLGATQPADGVGLATVFFAEVVVTFALVLVIISVATDERVAPAAAGLSVGFALFAAIMVAGPLTGGAVNPVRALAPMLVAGELDAWPMYLAGPLLGGLAAALLYEKVLRQADEPSEAEAATR